MRRRVYDLAGTLGFAMGANRLLLRNRAVAVVFHRVDDRYPGNPITVTEAEFREYCDFFERYFSVVPLSELVARLRAGRSIGRLLSITFDDGYLDNHRFAAAELERRGLPACFFITTGFIGSDRSPRWDAERGIRSEWMDWERVTDLASRGFEIGAHTVDHPDLGQIPPDEARREAAESRRVLEERIGAPIPHFCYPFGRTWHISEANRQVIRDLGFATCFASYGGTIRPGDDPYRLRRAPVHPWHRGPGQHGLELLFDRTG